ncbi:MAG: glycosyltransferase [Verrucomicrobiota bacterium]|nr:glycosyltransferase [Limisphaera sp.]MDW8380555.1 glycosyltransferase [Verrucomicrobiota bacterium]
MKISIIIPAYNEAKLLGGTLRAVRQACTALERRGWAIETIVCDNNSADETAQVAAAAGARVVFEPVNQIGRARNSGARVATGDWLWFVDADSWPDETLFDAVASCIVFGRVLAGGCRLRMDRPTGPGRVALAIWNLASCLGRWPAGAFLFVEAWAFREIGGFDERLYVGEEIDLVRRLRAQARARGQRIVVLWHPYLLTSARKLYLYTFSEYLRFGLRMLCHARKTVRNRETCHVWYDGRR